MREKKLVMSFHSGSAVTSMNRIQKLSLRQTDGHSDNPLEKILANLVEPAPLLNSFSVSFFQTSNTHILPQRLFSGEAPRLRELELWYCGLVWDAPVLHALTSLKMSGIHHAARPSMGQIMAVLCNMPNLETLDLCHILPTQCRACVIGHLRRCCLRRGCR
jgi:hypothetical protein